MRHSAKLTGLAKSGAKIAFRNSVPRGVTGFGNLDANRAEAAKIRASWENLPNARAGETAPLLESFGAKPENRSRKTHFVLQDEGRRPGKYGLPQTSPINFPAEK